MGQISPGPWITDSECGDECVLDADGFMVADCAIFGANKRWKSRRGDNAANASAIAMIPALLGYVRRAADNGCATAAKLLGITTRVAVPSEARRWIYAGGGLPDLPRHTLIEALGRLGDVYGPLPFEMFSEEAWLGNMLGYAHDLSAYRLVEADWRQTFRYEPEAVDGWRPAQVDSRRMVETHSGSMRSTTSPVVRKDDAPE